MIDVLCPLETCASKNDREAVKCWNCGGPLPIASVAVEAREPTREQLRYAANFWVRNSHLIRTR